MVKLDISLALFLYLFSTIIVIFVMWLWMDRSAKPHMFKLAKKNIWQCSVCHYIYIDTKDADFSRCPRCVSINQKEVRKV